MSKVLASVFAAIALAIGIGIGLAVPNGDSQAALQPKPTKTATSPTPSTVATDSTGRAVADVGARALKVGQVRHGTAIDTTILAVKDDYRDGNYRAPDGSMRWLGVQAKTCITGEVDKPNQISWSDFEAGNTDGESFPASSSSWSDFPSPQYPTGTDLQEGCRKGWLLIPVPDGAKVDVIRLNDAAEWVF